MKGSHMLYRTSKPLLLTLFICALIIGVRAWATPPADTESIETQSAKVEENSALVLIEFQKEWLGEDGKLVRLFDHPDRGRAAARRAKVALEAARESGMTVIHAPMILSPGYPELGDGKYGLRAAIPQAETWIGEGADFADGFEPVEGEPVVRGRVGASAFVGSDLQKILEQHGITTIYLAGFATHVCIESTMRHGHDLGYDVVVLRDACAAFNDEQDAYFDEHVLHHFAHAKPVEAFVAAIKSESEVKN
jgi:nicotinamidase-related amidase